MTTIHLALDAIDSDFTLGATYGRIVGMAMSVAGLRAQGFSQNPYAGNRLSTIEHDAAGFNSNCEPGWYRTPNGVQIARPMTQAARDLESLKNALRSLHEQLHGWADGLDALSRGQPARLVQAGHNWLYFAHYAAYLVGTNQIAGTTFNNLSRAQRIAWAGRMAQGAADVTSPFEFYQREGALLTSHPLYDGPASPATWVRPDNATALNLSASLYAASSPAFAATAAVDISNVNLSDGGWIDALTA